MRAVRKTMSLILQALINGLVSGALLAVPAIGFTAMFAVLRFPNFSVSGIATLGAFAGYVAYGAGLQVVGSLVVAFAVAGAVGLFFDRVAHQPLVKQGALPAAIASIASGLVLENVVRLGFGNDFRGYDRPIARDLHVGDIRFGPQQLETLAIALAIMLAVFTALAFTRIGKAMRASADNPELAALKGIRPQRVAMLASFVGMGLVGVGGMLLGLDSSIDPLIGARILLSIFAAAVLGGLGSPLGAVLGALLIGVAEEVSELVVGPQYREAIGFLAILVVLSLRPRGLLGERAF
jgi:branched-subunit amino acid ABC-type transport system permease component